MPNSVRDAILRGRDLMEADKDWGFDRSQFLNSSEADACMRMLWYSKNQPELAASQDWGFARRGNNVERYVVESFDKMNDVAVERVGDLQVSLQDDKRRLSATPDGVISFDGGPWEGLEIKSIDPRTNTGRLPKPAHVTQLRIAMALLNQEAGYNLRSGWLLYVDASNHNRMFEFQIDADDRILDTYAKRAKKLFGLTKAETIDREGKRTGECKYCPFAETCGVTEARNPLPARRPAGFDKAAARYVELADMEEQIKAEKDSLKEDLRSGLRGAGKLIVGDIEVSLSTTKGRTSLDKKAVAAAGINLSPFEKTGAPVERLTVKRVT